MKRNNGKKDFELKFSKEAFNIAFAHSNLSNEIKPYTQKIKEMNDVVEALDRYDDFSNLKIKTKQYEYDPEFEYGIMRAEGQPETIYAHQQKAAKRFLSELRGFGLLADVVGSGKTFEAGVVLSELAFRGRIKSILVVSPKQVYPAWINVLENCFGLGKGQLLELGESPNFGELRELEQGFKSPMKPCIVTMENFVNWDKNSVSNVLFDIIVVDEAHHLCDNEGQYSRAMELLSYMMEIKKKADKQFCALLSATPHSGNLENMFNLWYFIRANGGKSDDFVPGQENHSVEYKKEREYYKSHICHGASTVAEFIRIVKREIIEDKSGPYRKAYDAFLTSKNITEYENKKTGERDVFIDHYLDELEVKNEELLEEILAGVASQYHNEVLRPIMVRQERTPLNKKKKIVNFFFYPTQSGKKEFLLGEGETFVVDDFSVIKRGNKISYKEFMEESKGRKLFAYEYRDKLFDFVRTLWKEMGVSDTNFSKKRSIQYYGEQLRGMPIKGDANIENEFFPVRLGEVAYDKKLAKLKELLRKHDNERILLFFDYDKKNAKDIIENVKNDLLAESEFSSRICVGHRGNSNLIEKEFNEEKHARTILLVEDAAFTEGINLQSSQIIINFEVTVDPLAMDQRIGRIFRLGQQHDVIIYSLANMTELEGYVLMCFTSIGLLSSNSGDATILAGSSNERMVTIRCPACGRVKLISLEDYETFKADNHKEIYCAENEICRDNLAQRTEMTEICTYDFKCSSDECRHSFTRTLEQEGYSCMSVTNDSESGIMCNSGEKGDRNYYCRKICAISHCERFKEKTDCAALNAYKENKNVPEAELMSLCARCKDKSLCREMGCLVGITKESIKSCHDCEYSGCSPKPHVIKFNDKWEARCPVCERGTIKPVQARTFATFVRGMWDYQFDKGASFCENLTKEVRKVKNIRTILESDGERR